MYPEMAGTLIQVLVKEGDAVRKGQLLARIDELRAAGRVVIGELPGQVGDASQMGCAYRLQQQGDDWVVVPLEQSMRKR